MGAAAVVEEEADAPTDCLMERSALFSCVRSTSVADLPQVETL